VEYTGNHSLTIMSRCANTVADPGRMRGMHPHHHTEFFSVKSTTIILNVGYDNAVETKVKQQLPMRYLTENILLH